MLTIRNISHIESLDQIGNDLKVGVSISEDKEFFFLIGKDSTGAYSIISQVYTCNLGESVGDLVGAVEHIPGVPEATEVFSEIKGKLIEMQTLFRSLPQRVNRAKLMNTILFFSRDLFEYRTDGATTKKNLLALPLIVEIMNGAQKDGSGYNFKKCDKLLASMKKYQKTIATFSEDILLYPDVKNPKKVVMKNGVDHRYPSIDYSGLTTVIQLPVEHSQHDVYEAFIPDSFDDLIAYLLNRYVLNFHFYCCANCRRYFAFRTDSKIKNCSRVIESANYLKDIGRTCRDVGRLRAHVRGLYSNETQILYQRNYKAAFARLKRGKISEDNFTAWSEKAREMRDKCLEGDISYDELETWFMDNYLRE